MSILDYETTIINKGTPFEKVIVVVPNVPDKER